MAGVTRLSDFIAADRLVVALKSAGLPAAARTLLERLVAAGAVAHPERLLDRVNETRAEDIVAMGDRAFLLHYRTDAVSELCVALGTSPTPICRELGEGEGEEQCARVLLLVVAPPRLATRYLRVVGAFARFFASGERVDAVLAQPDAESLAALPSFTEYVLPEQLLVSDLMTRRPRTVGPDTPLREAARDMVRSGVGGLPVIDADRLVIGMLAERDLMRPLLNHYLQSPRDMSPGTPGGLTVRDAMTRQVLCVSPDQPVAEIAAIMANKDVDRVPVVYEGRLVGFLTRGDIVRKLIGS